MRLTLPALLLIGASACGNGANPPPDGGPPLALDVLDSSQIGLHYGKSTDLRVRYHADDPTMMPIVGGTVHFAIFGDPQGSTLAADHAITDSNGIASVTLTAGQAETVPQFKVAATAPNAPEADFDVSVSKFDFVEIDVQLAWTTPVTLHALLYDDKSCAMLPPATNQPAPARAQSKPSATSATLQFVNLVSAPYALVGRAEDANGQLVGYGCVDVGAELAPPGSVSTVPIPLVAVVPSPVATFAVTSTLVPDKSTYAAIMAKWEPLGPGCTYGAAQQLLDAMGITADRDPVDMNGCRPMSPSSLDEQVQTLLAASPTAPANALTAIVKDLGAILYSTTLKSTLTVTAASTTTFAAEHALASVQFAVAPLQKSYDLVALGEPVIDVKNVPFTDDGMTAMIGAHSFTLGWTTLWKQAFVDLSLSVRVMGLGSPPIPSLVQAIVAPASRNGKMGCAAVDDLVCSVTTGASTCTLATPCASALAPMAAALDAPFAPASGYDLTLAGSATPIDSDGDLVVDSLAGGTWTAADLAPGSTFVGMKQ